MGTAYVAHSTAEENPSGQEPNEMFEAVKFDGKVVELDRSVRSGSKGCAVVSEINNAAIAAEKRVDGAITVEFEVDRGNSV